MVVREVRAVAVVEEGELQHPHAGEPGRGEKFAHYRRLASLGDYVLVSQTEVALEVYSREGDTWVLRTAGPGESVPLSAMAGRIAADRVYAGVALEEPAAEAAS